MKRSTFVRPEAQTNIREAAQWYEDREPGLGIRFLREIRASLQHISDNPLMFPIIEDDVRRALPHRFSIFNLFRKRAGSDCGHRRASSTSPARHVGLSSLTLNSQTLVHRKRRKNRKIACLAPGSRIVKRVVGLASFSEVGKSVSLLTTVIDRENSSGSAGILVLH